MGIASNMGFLATQELNSILYRGPVRRLPSIRGLPASEHKPFLTKHGRQGVADEADGLDGQDDDDPPVVSFSSHFSNLRRRVTAQATVSGDAVMMIGSTKLACGPLLLLFSSLTVYFVCEKLQASMPFSQHGTIKTKRKTAKSMLAVAILPSSLETAWL